MVNYKATVKTNSYTAHGAGKSDHAAIQDAVGKLPNGWCTPNAAINVYACYENKDQLSYSTSIVKYLADTL